jgi:hypothetical protein
VEIAKINCNDEGLIKFTEEMIILTKLIQRHFPLTIKINEDAKKQTYEKMQEIIKKENKER